ncbi:MAG: hypothetical protein IBJ12_15435 [Sphingomonadaceae bacterium]|nr:hypothetical protein [Sphingomonadaceae bacterium]
MGRALSFPEGVRESHLRGKSWHRFANPAAVTGIGLFLAAALAGAFGGQPHPTRIIETPSARITLQFPERLRNGEFFEMRAKIEAKRDFADMGIALSSSYWRDLTINTMIPAPGEEKADDGDYLFSYGEIKAGDSVTVKIDGQINPPMFAGTKGWMKLKDAERTVARIPLELKVFP